MRAKMRAWTAASLLFVCTGIYGFAADQTDGTAALKKIDAAVQARVVGIESYTATEHYAVFRNRDEAHPVAEMTVKTIYNREKGKSYEIVSESGSTVIRSMVLHAILDNERHVNEPGVREGAWLTTANYEMTVKPGGIQTLDGHNCVAVSLMPRRKEPYLLIGTMWVDAGDGKIVRIDGKGSKSTSIFTGDTRMMRDYTIIDGFAEATHARAEAQSFLFGSTVITIDYRDYRIQRR